MPVITKRFKSRQANNVIPDATDRLLRAAKRKMLRDHGRIDYELLAREGFSPAMIERLKTL